jgi:nucleolar GTP-binding protein
MDETMKEIRTLARQIRDKKIIMRQERAIVKNSTKPVVPRTAPARVRARSASRLRSEMEELGVDMSDTNDVSIGSLYFNFQWQDLISQFFLSNH